MICKLREIFTMNEAILIGHKHGSDPEEEIDFETERELREYIENYIGDEAANAVDDLLHHNGEYDSDDGVDRFTLINDPMYPEQPEEEFGDEFDEL